MSWSRLRHIRHALVTCAIAVAAPGAALGAQEPRRPQLPSDADPRRWEPYFDLGSRILRTNPQLAEEAFYWASRIDPTRAEPLFGRYAAYFSYRAVSDVADYFLGDEQLMRQPEIAAIDSIRTLALMRNPFVHRGLEVLIFDRMPGALLRDRDTRAWLAYSNGDHPTAVTLFTRSIERAGSRARWILFDRAIAQVAMRDTRAGLGDLRALLAALREDDETRAVTFYQSKHFLLYMIGMIQVSQRDFAGARLSFQEALVEDASFAYAHAGLALLSRLQRANGKAEEEYAMALELAPHDAVLRFRRVEVLHDLQRYLESERELRLVIAAEPYWPTPHLLLGRVLERQGREAEAFQAWERYVSLAPADDAPARALKVRLETRGRAPASGTAAR